MADLRRRRHHHRDVDDDDEICEALIPQHDNSSDAALYRGDGTVEDGTAKHAQRDAAAIIRDFVERLLRMLDQLSACLQDLIPALRKPQKLSLIQEERLMDLQNKITISYNGKDPQHQAALKRLWQLAFPDVPLPEGTLKSAQWKEMGWQGEDPGTDFRGGGLFSLQNLVWMAEHDARLFNALLHKTNGTRSEWEYPFAVAGLNVTFALEGLLDLRNASGMPHTPAGSAFVALLEESSSAFEEVYCAAYELLDKLWLRERASYMQFGTIMAGVRQRVDSALQKRPATLDDFRELLQEIE